MPPTNKVLATELTESKDLSDQSRHYKSKFTVDHIARNIQQVKLASLKNRDSHKGYYPKRNEVMVERSHLYHGRPYYKDLERRKDFVKNYKYDHSSNRLNEPSLSLSPDRQERI